MQVALEWLAKTMVADKMRNKVIIYLTNNYKHIFH
jgi:hypothetical protein